MSDSPTVCPVCVGPAHILYRSYPGYREPSRYDIARCFACDTNFALANGDYAELYDQIYSQSSVLPGYDRYVRYASAILEAPNPLDFLAENELSFWAVRAALADAPKPATALDVGSGLGYFTFALNRSGFAAVGIDISKTAVRQAARRFGDHFVAAELPAYAQSHTGRYEVVVANSVIAHVPDLRSFFDNCLALAKPGGRVIVTTPNKGAHAPHALWGLAAPPVTLSWFSASSLSALARLAAVDVTLTDLSGHPRSRSWRLNAPREFVWQPPVLNADGAPRAAKRSIASRLRAHLRKRLNKDDFVRFPDDRSRPAPVLCAVFTKPG
jgi:SAM-dependent methyltransferase